MYTNDIPTDKKTARRFLLQTQYLWGPFPRTLNKRKLQIARSLEMIQQLECVQLDPVAAVERNHHLVLHARNDKYRTTDLEQLIRNGSLFEYVANAACLIPIEDYPMFEPTRNQFRAMFHREMLVHEPVISNIKERLRSEGPLPSRVFQSEKLVHGYWDNAAPKTKDTTLALNLLLDSGVITVAKRLGSERHYSLTEDHVPAPLLARANQITEAEAKMALAEKYMRAYRIFDFEDPRFGWYKTTAQERKDLRDQLLSANKISALNIDGVRRKYFILSEDVEALEAIKQDQAPATKTIRFLPPLDNLLWRRSRLEDLFSFHYKWEIYTTEEKREFGYYAMPILYGDALIGKIDPRYVRQEKKLVIKQIQLEKRVRVTKTLVATLRKALERFAKFHEADHIVVEKAVPEALLEHLTF